MFNGPRFSLSCNRKLVVIVGLSSATVLYLVGVYVPFTCTDVYDSPFLWEGFGPERGSYSFTVVTSMIDIGRGRWNAQSRKYNDYLMFMSHLLKLDVNMVIFIETKGRPFVEWMRRGRKKRTLILPITLQDLPYYKHRGRMEEIMKSVEYQNDNELLTDGDHCEARIPEYDIVQLSKIHLVNEAILRNPFNTSYYFWIDGGYGHGEAGVYPSDGVWKPVLAHSDKVMLLQLKPIDEWEHVPDLHKKNINILAGGVFGGGVDVLRRYHELHVKLIDEWMRKGIVDDDQTANIQLYFRDRTMFHLVRSGWFDLFKL
ncbi:protein HtrL-like isoform X2 [Gigantopelta aegis]|uniref:protein HtrL-like isoform X2 n=1 Tax=Gigantopelta aegis TaxID=1735272 RepID=UPI001B888D58|nr:protein HtrL-like isoform X2 [Gigantopelta aegis]